ncbi:hypothetical protein ACU4GD_02440 [Cupriavidus basilensis]
MLALGCPEIDVIRVAADAMGADTRGRAQPVAGRADVRGIRPAMTTAAWRRTVSTTCGRLHGARAPACCRR